MVVRRSMYFRVSQRDGATGNGQVAGSVLEMLCGSGAFGWPLVLIVQH